MASPSSLIKEPFVHFVVLGLGIFALWAVTGEPEDEAVAAEPIFVSMEVVQGLQVDFYELTGADPTEAELQELIDDRVSEEILYRQGRAAGLDKGDPIVRRRVVQKMRYLLEESAGSREASDAEVDAWMADHADRYRTTAAVAVEHVFFDAARRTSPADDAKLALDAVHAGADAPPGGDPFALGSKMGLRPIDRLGRELGPGFADALREQATGEWALVESTFGWHVVQITERAEAGELDAEFVRQQATYDLERSWLQQGVDAQIATLRAGYEVSVEESGR